MAASDTTKYGFIAIFGVAAVWLVSNYILKPFFGFTILPEGIIGIGITVLLYASAVFIGFRFIAGTANPFQGKTIFSFLLIMGLIFGAIFLIPQLAPELTQLSVLEIKTTLASTLNFP